VSGSVFTAVLNSVADSAFVMNIFVPLTT